MTEPKQFQQALAIGATGMLSGALEFIADNSQNTIIVARKAEEFFAGSGMKNATVISADYTQTDDFLESVRSNVDLDNIDLVLLWIHDTGREVLDVLMSLPWRRGCLIVHVLGSSTGDPRADVTKKYKDKGVYAYVTVVLGAIHTDAGWRWLTDKEVSQGAIEAIETRNHILVGQGKYG